MLPVTRLRLQFTSVATCCMNVERTELAEELLEMRDYL